MPKHTHKLPRSRAMLHDLVRVKRVNRQLRNSGMSYKAINKFWNDCMDTALEMPYVNPCALKYEERYWLRNTRKVLFEAGIRNGLIPYGNVD